jgi:ATP-dependent helicase/nuclease subunit A
MNIEIISASAGSGKTYTLAKLLEKEVREENARSDAILATTFTKKAAAELQERVRTKLLSAGLHSQAQQLAASRIGTVNSVCGQLLSDFAFELGISPFQKVLDEESTKEAINQALARVINSSNQKEIIYLQQKFEELDVRAVVSKIVSKARVNGLNTEAPQNSAKLSIDSFKALIGQPESDGDAIDRALENAIQTFLREIDTDLDTTKKTNEVLRSVNAITKHLQDYGSISWRSWLSLSRLDVGKKSVPVAEPLCIAAAEQDKHPGLHEDISRLITLVFDLSENVLDAYQDFKKEWGVVDFVDQEVLTLQLLEMKVVQEQLKSELDLILVDEFQDTSPIQIAIFLKLAQLANKSVWVGDQKQAIYGFRDADPVLMDAAIDDILKGGEPKTLEKSWRSRPELVRSTSDIFVKAFAVQGYPEGRVRLQPAFDQEPDGLSPIYEYWELDSKNKANDALSLASAVRAFLADENNMIRDPQTNGKRKVRGGDVAILCRENKVGDTVAEALEQQGIKAVLPRNGLLSCPETIIVLAALRFLIDSRDSLAKAELARIIDNPDQHNEWLSKAILSPWAKGFDLKIFSDLDGIRDEYQFSGPLEMLDRVIVATEVRSLCLQWGNSQLRLANLDAMRSHCSQYIDECQTEGKGVSSAGFISYMENLENDTQALVKGNDTVSVLTWHSGKGLEWPVTVLFQLNKVYKGKATDVNVVSKSQFDLNSPLADRWIRYWPYPYGKLGKGAPFHERLAVNPATIEAEEREERQELRLLYVGWTRARDKVILAGRKGFIKKGILRLLVDNEDNHLLNDPENDKAVLADRILNVTERFGAPQDPVPINTYPGTGYVATGPMDYPAAIIPASSVQMDFTGKEPEILGDRLEVSGRPDSRLLGEAVHTFLAADYDFEMENGKRLSMAKDILEKWTVLSCFSPESILSASDRLYAWANAKWPEAIWHREWPMELKTSEGTIIKGFIDLALEVSDGFVVIDHKSFHGGLSDASDKAATYGGQLWAYGEAIKNATGKNIKSRLIHFPVMGAMVEINER